MRNIIIIGAGPAGVTAGLEFMRRINRFNVVIFEETGEIGGISRTVKYHGNRMDIGGHRFFSKNKCVTEWWRMLMPIQGKPSYDDKILGRDMGFTNAGPDPDKTDRVMLRRNRVSRIYYKGKFFDYPVKMNANTIRNMGFLTTVSAAFSYLKATMFKKPDDSLENFYINRFGKKLYSMFFEGYTEKLWGRHPRDISADWGAQRVKGLSVVAIMKDILSKAFGSNKNRKVETSLIEEFDYPKFGPGQLWEAAADEFELLGGKLMLNSKVVGAKREGNRLVSVTYEKNGETFEQAADVVISSMPIKDLVNGINDVPEDMRNIANGLPYRDFVTVGLLLKKMNLKNETRLRTLGNIVPDCWIYVQDTGVKLGRIQIFNNWSCYMVEKPEETVWIGLEYFCDCGDEYWNMPPTKWAEFASGELVKMGVIDSQADVLDSHCEKVKKAYPAYFGTYNEMPKLIDYLNGIENLYCVGRNGQHRYNNMDHSMVTAFEALENIFSNRKDKDNIWSVNTEQDYHEEKHE